MNDLLAHANVKSLELELAVTLLMGTKAAIERLPARATARDALIARAQWPLPERAPKLVPYL